MRPAFAFVLLFAYVHADERTEYFEAKVRPVFAKYCYECHSAAKTQGGLAWDTKEGWQKGGDSGPAIVPGKPEESLLIKAIRQDDSAIAMPPKKTSSKLSDTDILALTEWVRMGAPDPRDSVARIAGMNSDEAKAWWAFQPLPKVDGTKNIDDFIDAKLADGSLSPVGIATPRALMRRASYDLTGLPPGSDEVMAFEQENSIETYHSVIERLLSSPQYGVHWGRHWLDVARYADTAGENTDRPLTHAWRYRNWVFDAFNQDMRYDDFVRYQIAGDLLVEHSDLPERNKGIIATGYLAVARRFGHDIDKDMHFTYEDVIDTLGKSFLGLTTGCARCHDHKYDPITAQDYYALYGIFESSRFSFPGCEPNGQPRDMVPLVPQSEIEAQTSMWKAASARFENDKKKQRDAQQSITAEYAALSNLSMHQIEEATIAEGSSQSFEQSVTVRKGEVVLLVVLPNASHGADSTQVEWRILEKNGTQRTWSVDELVPTLLHGNPCPTHDNASWCFLDYSKIPAFLTDRRPVLSGKKELSSWSLGSEPSVFVNAAQEPVVAWTKLAAKSFFAHPGPNRPVAVAWISPMEGDVLLRGRVSDAHASQGDGVKYQILHGCNPGYGALLVRLGELSKPITLPEPAPKFPVAYAVMDAVERNTRLQHRGDPEKLGEEIPRRWLEVFGGEVVTANTGSGRRQLADWIARSPLTARVMVNRIWEWHFGAGLVRSSNDFGAMGEKTVHTELLDWLAAKFVESNYSVKAMHRLIMNSAAYRRASAVSSESDPGNRLLAHFSRRRLTAEELRDSLLVASGQIDLAPDQSHPFPAEETWKFTQHDPFHAVYESNKRSAYLMVQRQRRHPFLSLFDGADPNATTAARQTTSVPTQALYFINDPFFHSQAFALARNLVELEPERERLDTTYRVLFQRSPNQAECERARTFLDSYPAPLTESWAALVRVLMACNEFLHVD